MLPDGISAPARTQLQTLCERLQTLLGEELVGIYLHGSLAMQCFHPSHSDLDPLVVNQQRMSVDTNYHLMHLLLRLSNAPYPIEISFLILSEIHPFEHPLPFNLHYSEMWRQQTSRELSDGTWRGWNEALSEVLVRMNIACRRLLPCEIHGSRRQAVLARQSESIERCNWLKRVGSEITSI
jgi:predicted nucleotidyltransferase